MPVNNFYLIYFGPERQKGQKDRRLPPYNRSNCFRRGDVQSGSENYPTRQSLFQKTAKASDPQNDCRGKTIKKTRIRYYTLFGVFRRSREYIVITPIFLIFNFILHNIY